MSVVIFDPVNFSLNADLVSLGIKLLLLSFLGFYFFFNLLVVRQVNVMNRTLETIMSQLIRRLAQIHLIAVAVVFTLILVFF